LAAHGENMVHVFPSTLELEECNCSALHAQPLVSGDDFNLSYFNVLIFFESVSLARVVLHILSATYCG